MTTATTSTAPSNIESRLAALEVTLGLPYLTVAGGEGGGDASDAPHPADLSARIDRIVSDLNSTVRERQAAAANEACLLYTSPSPRDVEESRMPSSA